MTKEVFENSMLECLKELQDNPNLIFFGDAVKEFIRDFADPSCKSEFQVVDLLTRAILQIKLNCIKNSGKTIRCGNAEEKWELGAWRKMKVLFRDNEKEFEELIISCKSDEELTTRQQALIRVAWNKIGWPVTICKSPF